MRKLFVNILLAREADPLDERDVLMLPGTAEGAEFSIGSRVHKANSEPGDSYPDGTEGTVLASHNVGDLGYAYFVAFDPMPNVPVLILGRRLAAV